MYGVPAPGGERSLAVAAVTARPGFELDAAAIADALAPLEPAQRPDLVHVVDEIPVTTWYRPNTAALRAAGVPSGDLVWRREGEAYVAGASAPDTIATDTTHPQSTNGGPNVASNR